MFTFGFICLVLANILPSSKSLVLDCTYSVRHSGWTIPNIYTCEAKLVHVTDKRNVTDVSRNHLFNRCNSGVLCLLLMNQNVRLIPRNIGEFFANLESLRIKVSEVEQVSRDDFRNMPRLKELDLTTNHIKELSRDLLLGNPLLQSLGLDNNPMEHLNSQVFENLHHLRQLHIYVPYCMTVGVYANNRKQTEELISQIARNCSNQSNELTQNFHDCL